MSRQPAFAQHFSCLEMLGRRAEFIVAQHLGDIFLVAQSRRIFNHTKYSLNFARGVYGFHQIVHGGHFIQKIGRDDKHRLYSLKRGTEGQFVQVELTWISCEAFIWIWLKNSTG